MPTAAPAAAEPVQLQATHVPEKVLANGWTPPPTALPDLPFRIRRTEKGGFIPVYANYKNANTRVVTTVRNIDGDAKVRRCKCALFKYNIT